MRNDNCINFWLTFPRLHSQKIVFKTLFSRSQVRQCISWTIAWLLPDFAIYWDWLLWDGPLYLRLSLWYPNTLQFVQLDHSSLFVQFGQLSSFTIQTRFCPHQIRSSQPNIHSWTQPSSFSNPMWTNICFQGKSKDWCCGRQHWVPLSIDICVLCCLQELEFF